MILTNYYLERLQANQIFSMAEFVVSENFNHHSNNQLPEDYLDEVNSIHCEEAVYFNNSEIFVSRDLLGSIQGTIRVLQWNCKDMLPLQKIFNINPFSALKIEETSKVYHIGRFAIKKAVSNINLLKQLMLCAIKPICNDKRNVAFAECDGKLLKALSILGIKTKVLGDSKEYLGSETIPIALTYDGLIDFYNQNKELLEVLREAEDVGLDDSNSILA